MKGAENRTSQGGFTETTLLLLIWVGEAVGGLRAVFRGGGCLAEVGGALAGA